MTLTAHINKVINHEDLTAEEMHDAMQTIMTGEATQAQIGGFLVALRMKGETVDEITAAAKVMRELSTKVHIDSDSAVDIVGTGGDGSGTFNISTASIFVTAAAGGTVAKHGNRSVSSKSGAADLLESAGINLEIAPEQVADCINELGVGFMFAQKHHSAMRHAIGARKELATRTIFNLLGPLTNPASAPNMVLGVFSKEWVRPLAEVLNELGCRHAMVVHADDGMDEISITGSTNVAELKDGSIHEYQIQPGDFGFPTASIDTIKVDSSTESLAVINDIFAGKDSPARHIVAMNAGAAIYVAGLAEDHTKGVKQALTMMDNGKAAEKLQALKEKTNA